MKFFNPKALAFPKVFYFYLPALDDKPAEVIEVLHGTHQLINVPMRDEDRVLKSFYQRTITTKEVANFGEDQVWQIFSSWKDLEEDHIKWKVPEEVLLELRNFKHNYLLSEAMPV